MAGKTKKVFLPKWQRWFLVPLLGGVWLFITYLEFFQSSTHGELGSLGYLFISLLFLGLGIMFWLMSSGKLPAYIIEEEEDG